MILVGKSYEFVSSSFGQLTDQGAPLFWFSNQKVTVLSEDTNRDSEIERLWKVMTENGHTFSAFEPKIEAGSADICNLNELALASLGFKDDHPQVPLEKIIDYVKDRLGNDGK